MEVNFYSTLQNVNNQVNETTMTMLEYVNDENLKGKYLKQLEEVLASCVSCEHKVAILRQAVKEATSRAEDEATGEPNSELFDDLVDESIAELEVDSPLEEALVQAASLKSFKELLEQHNAAESTEEQEEVGVTQYSHSVIDPISKKRMTSPVKNKLCGHVYDRNSVTSMISAKHKNGFRCPAMGCANRRAMKLSDLEPAHEVKRQLTQMSLEERNAGV